MALTGRSYRAALILAAVFVLADALPALPQETTAADEMHAGIIAFKFSDYSGAAEHFRTALELNPSLSEARLYLATAYARQYTAGDESAANIAMAEQAIDEFKKVLSEDPPEQEEY